MRVSETGTAFGPMDMSMRVLDWSELLEGALNIEPPHTGTAATIGVFDGIHLGHQVLIAGIARQAPLVPTAITFRQNPKVFLGKGKQEGDILSLRRRLAILESLGVDLVVLIDFSEEFSRLTGKEFFDLLRKWGRPKYITVGSNFHCGYRADTGAEDIKKLCEGISVEVAEPVLSNPDGVGASLPISSSRIRQAIVSGDIRTAEAMLGRRVELDLTDLVATARSGGEFFAAPCLVKPAPATYLVALYGNDGETEALATVEEYGIYIPSGTNDFKADRIEFIQRADPKPCYTDFPRSVQ